MGKLDYVHAQLVKMVGVLVSHPGPIRERLIAARSEVHGIIKDDLPDSLKADWDYIEAYLGVHTDLDKAMRLIVDLPETELVEITDRISSFEDRVDIFLREERS